MLHRDAQPKPKTSKRRTKRRAINMVVPPASFGELDASYAGDAYIWDLDKTYLRTEFATFRELLRTALQKAKDKVTYPGATALLRALRTSPTGQKRPIYFVSASPPQLAQIVAEKFALDGVEVDGIYFKDNLRNVRPGRLDRIKEQMGYKLLALLDLRRHLPAGAREHCFGDDVETDVAIYALYGQILSGWLRGPALVEFLRKQGVFRDEAVRIAWLTRNIPHHPPPPRIYIQVHRTVDPRYYKRYGAGVMATTNYFQTALLLYAEDKITVEAVAEVGRDILARGGISGFDLLESLDELLRRRMLPDALAVPTIRRLAELDVLPKGLGG